MTIANTNAEIRVASRSGEDGEQCYVHNGSSTAAGLDRGAYHCFNTSQHCHKDFENRALYSSTTIVQTYISVIPPPSPHPTHCS